MTNRENKISEYIFVNGRIIFMRFKRVIEVNLYNRRRIRLLDFFNCIMNIFYLNDKYEIVVKYAIRMF